MILYIIHKTNIIFVLQLLVLAYFQQFIILQFLSDTSKERCQYLTHFPLLSALDSLSNIVHHKNPFSSEH